VCPSDQPFQSGSNVAILSTINIDCLVLFVFSFSSRIFKQIFTFLWFWFIIVILCTVYDSFVWIYRLFFRRELFLRERLKVLQRDIAEKWPFDNMCQHHRHEQPLEGIVNCFTCQLWTIHSIVIYLFRYLFRSI
jgi:hypothetical protein